MQTLAALSSGYFMECPTLSPILRKSELSAYVVKYIHIYKGDRWIRGSRYSSSIIGFNFGNDPWIGWFRTEALDVRSKKQNFQNLIFVGPCIIVITEE